MMEEQENIQALKGKNVVERMKKNRKMENKRRFSDEQIRSLECIFESESKLEPRKKMQLATDLGLQPRQVAIWFQNRRARWKSKRIEQEYRKLKDEYDNLASKFESLKEEKESLQSELNKLNYLMERSNEGKENSAEEGGSGSGYSNCKLEVEEAKPRFSNVVSSDDQNERSTTRRVEKSEEREEQVVRNYDDHEEIPLSSIEKWYSVDPSVMYDQSCSSSQWLDFWT